MKSNKLKYVLSGLLVLLIFSLILSFFYWDIPQKQSFSSNKDNDTVYILKDEVVESGWVDYNSNVILQ